MKLLQLVNLHAAYCTPAGEAQALRGVSLELERGDALGLVGESGSGKTTAMLAALGRLALPGRVTEGRVIFENQDVTKALEDRQPLGEELALYFQPNQPTLDPLRRLAEQLTAALARRKRLPKPEARARAYEALGAAGLAEAAGRYPHELSPCGLRQATLAAACMYRPKLLVADEPTAALDGIAAARMLSLLAGLRGRPGFTLVVLTHDPRVALAVCDRVAVLYGGLVVETGGTGLFDNSFHPYTRSLRGALRDLTEPRPRPFTPQGPEGQPADPLRPLQGCPFAPRCPHTLQICLQKQPPFYEVAEGQRAACYLNDSHAKRWAAFGNPPDN